MSIKATHALLTNGSFNWNEILLKDQSSNWIIFNKNHLFYYPSENNVYKYKFFLKSNLNNPYLSQQSDQLFLVNDTTSKQIISTYTRHQPELYPEKFHKIVYDLSRNELIIDNSNNQIDITANTLYTFDQSHTDNSNNQVFFSENLLIIFSERGTHKPFKAKCYSSKFPTPTLTIDYDI